MILRKKVQKSIGWRNVISHEKSAFRGNRISGGEGRPHPEDQKAFRSLSQDLQIRAPIHEKMWILRKHFPHRRYLWNSPKLMINYVIADLIVAPAGAKEGGDGGGVQQPVINKNNQSHISSQSQAQEARKEKFLKQSGKMIREKEVNRIMRIFAYCRVSTTEQTTENQITAIRQKGYEVIDSRIVSETVSGSVEAMKREKFKMLINHQMEKGDMLVVLKLDRLGRDNIDVQSTINLLTDKGIKVVCLDLPVADLSSAEGKLMLQMFSAFAEFERNRIRERTKEGLERAKTQGIKLGRPVAKATTLSVQVKKSVGLSQSKTAEVLGLGIATVKRHWNK